MRKPPFAWTKRRRSRSPRTSRIAVRREADDLAFVPARREPERRRHRLVERAERVRILEAVDALDLAVAADADAAGQARAVAVERDDQRLVEAARVVRVGRVAQVVLDALQLAAEADLGEAGLELLLPLEVKLRRVAAPLLGAALGDVARDDALAGEHAIGEVLEQALLHAARSGPPGPAPARGRVGTRACALSRSRRCVAPASVSSRNSRSFARLRSKSRVSSSYGQERIDDAVDLLGLRARCGRARPRARATESRPAA